MMKTFGISLIVLAAAVAMLFACAPAPPSSGPASAGQPAKELTLDLGDKVTLKLVEIPAGKFLMGSPTTEKVRDTNESQHEVTITKPFYMGITHVTVDQFAAFAKDANYKTDAEKSGQVVGLEIKDGMMQPDSTRGHSWRDPGFPQTGNHPAVVISWNDAQAFCDWLAKKSGKNVQLPTEAQWEYACRARNHHRISLG